MRISDWSSDVCSSDLFVTQNPGDLPDAVLGQLGNRVQHALRAFTPRDRKAVQTAADTFRQNPGFDARTAITELRVGEALVSTLQAKGVPEVVLAALEGASQTYPELEAIIARDWLVPGADEIGSASRRERGGPYE